MSPKAHTQSNTLLNATQSSAATKAFKRVSLSHTKEKLFFKISSLSKKFLTPDHTKLTPADIIRNVWKHEQSKCKLLLTSHHPTRKPAGNS
jgi:hypothetical protein